MYKGGFIMAGYKRWISYIYSYENGEKKQNIGYARIETRDKNLKVTIHINVLSVNDPMKVYLYVRENGDIKGICMGEIVLKNGVGEAVYITDAQSIADSTYGIGDVCGLIIFHNEGRYFGSEWDDRPIILANGVERVHVDKKEIVPEESAEDVEICSLYEESNPAEKLLSEYPRMYPFDDNRMQSCVRIEPQDIGRLPIEAWSYANNSFLLHGYYSYRHLVLMKTADPMHPAYYIGVPGIYRNKDEFMAKMFGFELFKPMSEKEDMSGEFGYWCAPITDIVL